MGGGEGWGERDGGRGMEGEGGVCSVLVTKGSLPGDHRLLVGRHQQL